MTKATFIGSPDDGNVGSTSMGPYKFELNKPVEVTDERILGKLKNNISFEVEGEPKRERPAAAVADDDDDDDAGKSARSPLRRR